MTWKEWRQCWFDDMVLAGLGTLLVQVAANFLSDIVGGAKETIGTCHGNNKSLSDSVDGHRNRSNYNHRLRQPN